MAKTIEYCAGFDNWGAVTEEFAQSGTSNNGLSVTSSAARTGGKGLRWTDHSVGYQILSQMTNVRRYGIGLAFRIGSPPSGTRTFFALMDGTTVQAQVSMNTSGQFIIATGGAGFTTTLAISINTWYHLELCIDVVNTSGGTVTLYVDGISWGTASGDTQASANAYCNGFRLGAGAAQNNSITTGLDWDDIVVWSDDTGITPLGDAAVNTLTPTGNGNSSVLVGSDGNSTDNYLLVDETAPDSDTTYVVSGTATDKDTYAFSNLPDPGTVHAVKVGFIARREDAGAATIKTVARHSGTETNGPTVTPNTTYSGVGLWGMFNTKPGGGAWSVSDVDGAEFGVEIVS